MKAPTFWQRLKLRIALWLYPSITAAENFLLEEKAQLEADNEMLIDALEHCGYDPTDCIDCGGPPHNEYCRFWKLRHRLSFFDLESE